VIVAKRESAPSPKILFNVISYSVGRCGSGAEAQDVAKHRPQSWRRVEL